MSFIPAKIQSICGIWTNIQKLTVQWLQKIHFFQVPAEEVVLLGLYLRWQRSWLMWK